MINITMLLLHHLHIRAIDDFIYHIKWARLNNNNNHQRVCAGGTLPFLGGLCSEGLGGVSRT
jgi:hypothetical protein